MTKQLKRLIWLAALFMILIPAVYVLADETEADHDRFTVSCSEVENDIIPEDNTWACSVRMQITNNGEDFDGTIKILAFEGSETDAVNAIGKTLEFKSGETKTIYFKVPNVSYDGTPYSIPLRVDFLDEDGKLLCRTMTDFQAASDDNYAVAAGIYTDDTQKMTVIDQSKIKYETASISGDVTMKSRRMTEEELDNIQEMNVNLLILDKAISESEWENISKWVMYGGHVMAEQGVYHRLIAKTLNDGNMTDWGKGRILVYASEDWSGTFFLKAVRNIFGDEGFNALFGGDYTDYYWNVMSMLNYDTGSELPSVSVYVFCLLIYILCMGPAVYLFLKKKDKREYMWLVIPCTAILFSVIIYMAGNSTRYTESFIRYYSSVDLTDEATVENTKILLTSPDKEKSVMSIEGDCRMVLLSDEYYLPLQTGMKERFERMKTKLGEAEYNTAMSVSDTRTDVLVRGRSAFDKNYFSNSRILKTEGSISADMFYYKGALSGTVTNTTKWNLHNAFVIHKGLIFMIGDLAAGETKTLDQLQNVQLLKSRSVQLDTWQMDNPGNTAAVSSVMSGIMDNLSSNISREEDMVGGFTMDYDIGVQDSGQISSVCGLTLIKSGIEVADSGKGWSSQVMLEPQEAENEDDLYNFDPLSYLIYGSDTLNARYIVGDVTGTLYMKWLNKDDLMNVAFYNLSTGVYDAVMEDSDMMTSEQLKDYISKDRVIKVRVQLEDMDEDHYMPVFTLSGGEKND